MAETFMHVVQLMLRDVFGIDPDFVHEFGGVWFAGGQNGTYYAPIM